MRESNFGAKNKANILKLAVTPAQTSPIALSFITLWPYF